MLLGIAQIAISILIIVLILLQERQTGLSGIFGGEGAGFYQTRRGLERVIFVGTVVLAVVFILLSVIDLIR